MTVDLRTAGKARVLVVDDSGVFRQLLLEALAADPEIEMVGAAADGAAALQQILETRPDVVTLDVEMPGMNGLDLLKELRKTLPDMPIIMCSHLTERGTRTTLDALCLGASDYVPKPPAGKNPEDARAHLRRELIPRIKALYETHWRNARGLSSLAGRPARRRIRPGQPFDVLAVGASTGGPNALERFLSGLGGPRPVPMVIVQHMPPLFTTLLAERLSRESPIRVREAEDGAALHPGEAWLAPGNRHLLLRPGSGTVHLHLSDDPPENSCRPSVDVLFRSVSQAYGARALAVVLTGMGHDGLKGAQLMREAGGHILVQDEASSVIWGMPGAIAREGLADEVLSIERLAQEVCAKLGVAPRREGE